jgi:hypothetical protein
VFRTFRCQRCGESARRLAVLMGLGKNRGPWFLQAPVPSTCCGHGTSLYLANRLHDDSCCHQGVSATLRSLVRLREGAL